jgi:hypothetical protein
MLLVADATVSVVVIVEVICYFVGQDIPEDSHSVPSHVGDMSENHLWWLEELRG